MRLGNVAVLFSAFAFTTLGLPASAVAQPGYGYPSPYGYRSAYAPESHLRITVTPKDASVYVDGYFAGRVSDYDGVFQRLHVSPGEHDVVIYHDGYRSLQEKLYLRPNATQKISGKMEALAAGEPNEAPPAPVNVPEQAGPPPGNFPMPGPPGPYGRRMPPPFPPQSPQAPQAIPPDGGPGPAAGGPQPFDRGQTSSVGTIAIRVQPAGSDIMIDGEHWSGPSNENERLIIQLSDGQHVIDIHRQGYRDFSTEITVRPGETTPVNVSLTRE